MNLVQQTPRVTVSLCENMATECATYDVVGMQMLQCQKQLSCIELRLWLCEQTHLAHPKEQRSAIDCDKNSCEQQDASANNSKVL